MLLLNKKKIVIKGNVNKIFRRHFKYIYNKCNIETI